MKVEKNEQKEDKWRIYFDDVANMSLNSLGAIVISPCIKNVAEYEACVNGLQATLELNFKSLEVFGDFAIIISQSQRRMTNIN